MSKCQDQASEQEAENQSAKASQAAAILCTTKKKVTLPNFAMFVDNNWEELSKQSLHRQANLTELGNESGALMAVNYATTASKTASESPLDTSRT